VLYKLLVSKGFTCVLAPGNSRRSMHAHQSASCPRMILNFCWQLKYIELAYSHAMKRPYNLILPVVRMVQERDILLKVTVGRIIKRMNYLI
jgi:hypothetical protein